MLTTARPGCGTREGSYVCMCDMFIGVVQWRKKNLKAKMEQKWMEFLAGEYA